ncbi:hypothetical protein ACTFIY_003689 [Dictyostelium cf. discoideum]
MDKSINEYINKFIIDKETFSKIKLEDDELFFKVWRNVYLRNKYIFYHLRKFNIANNNVKHSFDSLLEYPLRNYLTFLKISNDETKINDEAIGAFIPNKIIPNSVEDLIINQNLVILKGDIRDSIKTIKFDQRFKEYIDNDMLPKNLIKLRLGHNTKISDDLILPKNLKYLSIERKCQLPLLDQVISSIEFLCIEECDSNTKIPKTIKNLGFSREFHNKLPRIPKNIEFLYFGNKFNKEIDFLNLSHLKVLKIGRSKRFLSLIDFSTNLKQLVYLKVYMYGDVKEGYVFNSLKILNINNQDMKIFFNVDPIYLKVYMAGNVKEGYIFESLKILNINDQQIKTFCYVDPTIINEN